MCMCAEMCECSGRRLSAFFSLCMCVFRQCVGIVRCIHICVCL